MSESKKYLDLLRENGAKNIFFEDKKVTLEQLLNTTVDIEDQANALDIYHDDMKLMLQYFIGNLDNEKSLLLYDQKGMEEFDYYSICLDTHFPSEFKLPNNSIVFRTSGSTGGAKFVLHDKEKSISKILMNYERKKESTHSLVMLHHGHIAWWESVLSHLLCSGDLFIINDFPLDGKSYPDNLVVRTTPSYLRLCFAKGYFHTGEKFVYMLGSEPISDNLISKINELGHHFYIIYGSTELWGLYSKASIDNPYLKFEDVEAEFLDDQLFINNWPYIYNFLLDGQNLIKPEQVYETHDLVEQHASGIRIIGRTQDFINVGGVKYHSSQIKEKVESLNFIEECLVFPVENVLLGQVVGIEIILSEQNENYIEEIREIFEEKEMMPVHIKIVKDFKRTKSKKIARKL